jgi:hypothetical protein
MSPGSIEGLTLVVDDADAARAELIERGVEAGERRASRRIARPPNLRQVDRDALPESG